VLGVRFAHRFGSIDGRFNVNNILFDSNHDIQIADFLCGFGEQDVSGFSKEGWNSETEVRGFASILSEIIAGRPAKGELDSFIARHF
jgi:hypothetical protein